MMKRAFIIGLTLFVTVGVFATDNKAGTSGAQFLKIGAGARPTAMGDAFVGVADDVNAVYYNPAGLAFISRPEMTAMHTQWIEGINYDFGAFAYPTDLGAFAVSAATLKVDEIQKRGTNEALQGTFDSLDAAYGLSFARTLGPLTSLGLTARYIKQDLDTESASAWSGDVGVYHRFGIKPLTLGFAVRHLGQEIKFKSQSDPQPLTLDVGMGASLMRERLKCAWNIKKSNDEPVYFGLGSEWNQPLGKDMSVSGRLGYNNSRSDIDGASGISLGGGMAFRQFDFDFAWVPFGDLGNTIRYSARIKF